MHMEKKRFECSFANCVHYRNGLCDKPELYNDCKYSKLMQLVLIVDFLPRNKVLIFQKPKDALYVVRNLLLK